MPESWVWTTISTFTHNLTYGTSEKSNSTGLIPVLRMGNINRKGGLDWDDLVFTSNKYDIIKYNLEYNDLLFNRTNSSDWVGKTAIYKGERKAIFAGYLIRLRTICINADYLNLVMNSSYHREWCDEVKTDAVNQSNINAQKLSCFSVPIPPLAEQKRIVDMVASWLVLIDQIEQDQASLTTIIKQAKNKILTLAIHGKLVPQDPNDEPAIELLKRVNPNFTPCDNAHYGKLPEGWCFSKLGSIGVWQSGGTPSRSSPAYYDGVIPWLKIADLPDGYVTNCSEKISHDAINNSSAKVNPEGSVALAMYGSIGKLGILTFQAATNQAICVCSLFKGVDSKYLFYFLMSQREEFIRKAGGGVQSNISKDIIVNHPITLPPLAEQLKIVAKIERLFSVLNSISFSLQE